MLLFWLSVWALAARSVGQELLIPSPFSVGKHLIAIALGKSFLPVIGASLLRVFSGFALGCMAGTLLAVLCSVSGLLDALIRPLVRTAGSIPVTSFIILVMLWLKYTYVPVFISALLVTPLLFSNVSAGVKEVDRGLLEVAKIFEFSRFKTLTRLYVPSVLPYFYSGALTGLGLAWKAGIAAEVLALPKNAIGSNMYYSKLYLETADLFAWTVLVIAFSFALESLIGALLKKLSAKREPERTVKEDEAR